MSESRIRPASPADLDALLAIEARRPTAPGWSRAQFGRELDFSRGRLLVLEQSGHIAGYAGVWLVPPEAQVSTVVVAPEEEGKGLGRRLLEALVKLARESACTRLTLEASAENPRALALYKAAGFRVVGRRPKFYNDGSDAVLMDLAL